MTDFAQLVLAADTRQLKDAVKVLDDVTRAGGRAEDATDGVTGSATRLNKAGREATGTVGKLSGEVGGVSPRAVAAAKALGAMVGAALSFNAIGNMTAQYTEMANSLRVLGVAEGEVAAQLEQIAGVAAKTRSPVEAMAQLYGRVSIAAGELGASQADMLRFTETVGFALGQQGGSAAAASGALIQLSQAMAGGTVRAEEFNSMLEGAYPIVAAAARGIDEAGGSVAKLRNLVVEGKISSEEFFRAILSQSGAMEEAFARSAPTVGSAMQQLRDQLMLSVGSMDAAMGASAGLAKGILWVAEKVQSLRQAALAGEFDGWMASIAPLVGAVQGLGGIMADTGGLIVEHWSLIGPVVGAVALAIGALSAPITLTVAAVALLAGAVYQNWDSIKAYTLGLVQDVQARFAEIKAAMLAATPDWLESAWAAAVAAVKINIDVFRGAFAAVFALVQGDVEGFKAALGAIPDKIKERLGEVTGHVQEMGGRIIAALKEAGVAVWDAAKQMGFDLVEGIKAGIVARWEGLKATVTGLGTGLVGSVKNLFQIRSPSRVMREIGVDVVDGLIVGISGRTPAAKQAVAELAGDLVGTAREGLGPEGLASDIAGWMVDGFKGGLKGLKDLFKNALRDMATMAAKNRIIVQMGAAGGFSPAQVLTAQGGPDGASGGGGLLGGIGGLFGSFGAGGSAALTGLFSGGFGGAIAGVKTAMGAATGFLAKTATVLGAVALPLMLLSGLIGSKKTIGAGVQGTISGADTQAQNFTTTQRKFLFGLIKSTSTNVSDADPKLVSTLRNAAMEVDRSIISMADTLAIGADAVRDFTHDFKVDTMGMTEDQAMQALMTEVAKYGEGLAALVLGGEALVRSGETAMDALVRLSASLTTVNGLMDTLGHSFRAVGLVGADMASKLADAFGGLDAMSQAGARYFELFHTEAEQLATVTRQATEALAKVGLAMPRTRAEYRAMVEALDLTTDKGRQMYAALVGMADVMDGVLPVVSNLSVQLAGLVGSATSQIDEMIAETTAAARANETAARNWYRASDTIRQMVDRMRGTAGVLVSAQQAAAFAQTRYQTTLAAALSGDLTAAGNLPQAAQALLDATRGTARSALDMARIEARILSDLGLAAGVGDIEGARHDVIAGLLGDQVAVLEQVRDYLNSGGVLDPDQIDALNGQLGGLQDAIAAAEMINYAFLKERLAVSVDLLADADVPPYLKRLIAQAQSGITSTIDFVTRSDLDPDMKWLALTGQSELIKTVDLITGNTLPPDVAWIALETTSRLRKTVNLIAGADIDAATKRIALAGNSELARTVNATLASTIDPEAKRLALGNIGAYAVAVQVALAPGMDREARRIVLTQQGGYSAMIRGAISADIGPCARRILLEQQGTYTANIVGVLASAMDAPTRRLLLEANTNAARAITVSAIFASGLTADQRAALSAQALTVQRTIRAAVNASGLSATGALYLAQIGLGDARVQKSLVGSVALSALSDDARLLLNAIDQTVTKSVAFKATGAATEDQLRLLGAVSASILRQVDLNAKGWMTADQRDLLGAAAGTVRRLLDLSATGTLTADQHVMLAAAAGAVARIVELTATGSLTEDQRRVLSTESGKIWRNFNVWSFGNLTEDQSAVLHHVGDKTWRNFNVWAAGALSKDQSAVLHHVGDKTWRTFNVWANGTLSEDQRRVITLASGTVWRTVKAAVDMTALNDRQKSLIDAISGGSVGKITLGGGFTFDPSTGFRIWFEGATETSLRAPMDSLRVTLGALAQTMRDEAARQSAATDALRREMEKQRALTGARSIFDAMVFDSTATHTDPLTGWKGKGAAKTDWAGLYQMAEALGVSTKWGTGVLKTADQMRLGVEKAMREAGLLTAENMLWLNWGYLHGDRAEDANKAWSEWLKTYVPGFAGGGMHAGGLRIVGENGPEIEATGPARYYSNAQTRQMLAGGEAAAEIRALRDEVARMREEQRSLGMTQATAAKRSQEILRRWEDAGLPQERV